MRPLNLTPNRAAHEVFAADSPLVVQRDLVSGEQTAAAADVLAQLLALRVRQRRDIRKYEQLEFVDVGRVQQAVVRHLKRDARFDQRLVRPRRMIVDQQFFVGGGGHAYNSSRSYS